MFLFLKKFILFTYIFRIVSFNFDLYLFFLFLISFLFPVSENATNCTTQLRIVGNTSTVTTKPTVKIIPISSSPITTVADYASIHTSKTTKEDYSTISAATTK